MDKALYTAVIGGYVIYIYTANTTYMIFNISNAVLKEMHF